MILTISCLELIGLQKVFQQMKQRLHSKVQDLPVTFIVHEEYKLEANLKYTFVTLLLNQSKNQRLI